MKFETENRMMSGVVGKIFIDLRSILTMTPASNICQMITHSTLLVSYRKLLAKPRIVKISTKILGN